MQFISLQAIWGMHLKSWLLYAVAYIGLFIDLAEAITPGQYEEWPALISSPPSTPHWDSVTCSFSYKLFTEEMLSQEAEVVENVGWSMKLNTH